MIVIALQNLLPTITQMPSDLVQIANAMYLESMNKITALRPDVEASRYTVCAQLAIESLRDRQHLPEPIVRKSPIAPRAYTNLLSIFRNSLVLSSSSPGKPSTPTKQNKRIKPATPTSADPSPRRRTKNNEPSLDDIESLCMALGLSDSSAGAVAYGYKHFNALEKWVLLGAMLFMIVSRAQPELLGDDNDSGFNRRSWP
jgi:hypothetical protein